MSLRTRLLAGLVVVALVLVAACVLVTRTTEAYLVGQVDERLDRGRVPVTGASASGSGAEGSPFGDLPAQPAPQPADQVTGAADDGEVLTPFYLGVLADDGTLVSLVSPNVAAEDQPEPGFDPEALLALAGDGPTTVVDGDGQRYRVDVGSSPVPGEWVVLAQSLAEVDTAVDRLVLLEAVAVAAVVLVLGLVFWWVERLGVRPVKRMAEAAGEIAAGDLSHRVPEARPGTEAADLGRALNRMLTSIEGAFDERTRSEEQVRRFVADASHELRTPVATIRGYAELHRSGGLDDPEELDEAMRRTEQEAIRMGVLVDDLLALARLDQGRPLVQEPVDLRVLVQDVVRDAEVQDPERTIAAQVGGEPLEVVGDDHRLRQVLVNLVGNALVHTPAGTPVEVGATRTEDGWIDVTVVDHGDGMDDEVRAHAFERFYRADPARTRHRGGSGLGLAIVQAVVEAHAGTVALTETEGGGTTATVRLPASDAHAGAVGEAVHEGAHGAAAHG